MRIAVLVMCHTDADRVNRLVDTLIDDDIDVFIHVDRKSKIEGDIKSIPNKHIRILPGEYRIDVRWAQFSMVQATLGLLTYASETGEYDYYILLSGFDYPIVPMAELKQFLASNNGYNFLDLAVSKNYRNAGRTNNRDKCNEIVYTNWLLTRHGFPRVVRRLWVCVTGGYKHTFSVFKRNLDSDVKFYFGSQWWCLSGSFVEWMQKYIEQNPQYEDFYKRCSTPDESFFHTLLMNSPFAETRKEALHYIDWSAGGNSPKELTIEDFSKIIKSGKMFARKISDKDLLDRIDQYICA